MEQIVRIEFPNLYLVVPELIVLITGFILFTLDLFYKRLNHKLALTVSFTGFLLAFMYIVLNLDLAGQTFYGLYVRDTFS